MGISPSGELMVMSCTRSSWSSTSMRPKPTLYRTRMLVSCSTSLGDRRTFR